LRLHDHEPLFKAEQDGLPYLLLFLVEPSFEKKTDPTGRHTRFCLESVQAINNELAGTQARVTLLYAEAKDAFSYLTDHYEIKKVFSYQESGTPDTWERDKIMAGLFRAKGITWKECQKDGVLRAIQDRQGWDQSWNDFMAEPLFHVDIRNIIHDNRHPFHLNPEYSIVPDKRFQPGGTAMAIRYIRSFTSGRAQQYSRHISKPSESRISCSRLSPYLAWGNLSLRQATQHFRTFAAVSPFRSAIRNAATRLHWRDHFIQKFETDCSMSLHPVHPGYADFPWNENEEHLEAWMSGLTGFPLVDACMRCLHQTGWINFRMRAMLVSFLCHHLLLDWRKGAAHLAALFLDYEPGIHYPQLQMQAGTTGYNTIRIYNPWKQSAQHDPDGLFIRKWVPEIRHLPPAVLHDPLAMANTNGNEYPKMIIDPETVKTNRVLLWEFRKRPGFGLPLSDIRRRLVRP
jgi:deoxyribodipyrimidine photo-lyase